GRGLKRHRVGARLLAGSREPLAETEEHQQNWSEDPNLVVRRQAADEEGRSAHQDQCQDEDGLPSQFVTDMTEEERANRAGDIAHPEGRQCQEKPRRGVASRKEDLAEDERGPCSVNKEIIVFESASDPAC